MLRKRIQPRALLASENSHRLFWLLLSTTITLVALYMILIQSTIYNVVVEKKTNQLYNEIQTEKLAMEEEYLSLSEKFELELVANLGLEVVDKNNVHYVEVGNADRLTLHTDGQ